jgi:hypothetical protein
MDRRRMLVASLASPLLGQTLPSGNSTREFYEIRWFYLRNGSHAPRMLDLLRNHWAAAAKKLGVRTVGCFQPVIGEQGPSVMMLSVFHSADEAVSAADRMLEDADFAAAYAKAMSPEPAFERMEATLLRAFQGMPTIGKPLDLGDKSSHHVFEMRTYESNSALSLRTKVEMFNGGEIQIFQRLGMAPIFFGEAIFGHNLPHLTYMLSFADLEARERAWKEFGSDPGFTALRSKPGYSDAEIVATISNTILQPLSSSEIR